jgi:pimeloyl-ACP methyl ester carboxylesterase
MSTWILLRGLTREQAHWGDFPDLLRQALPADTCILTPDLPGNGTLWQSRSPSTVQGMVDHSRQALRDAGHLPPYHVLAMSLGAMVTVDWATRHPEELTSAILISTSLRPFSPLLAAVASASIRPHPASAQQPPDRSGVGAGHHGHDHLPPCQPAGHRGEMGGSTPLTPSQCGQRLATADGRRALPSARKATRGAHAAAQWRG